MLRLVPFIISVSCPPIFVGAVLELENPPCIISCAFFVARGQIGRGCLQSIRLVLGLALPIVAALSGRDGVAQTGHRRPMASLGRHTSMRRYSSTVIFGRGTRASNRGSERSGSAAGSLGR